MRAPPSRIFGRVISPALRSISIPGKVFVIGEYAVMEGAPALVAAVEPRFRFDSISTLTSTVEMETESEAKPWTPHPSSPAGQLLALRSLRSNFRVPNYRVLDPHAGAGGFGGSTAEFLAAAHLAGMTTADEIYRVYREEIRHGDKLDANARPSGADLVAQFEGGALSFTRTGPAQFTAESVTDLASRIPMLLFSASHLVGRKTRTHTHLVTHTTSTRLALQPIIESALTALRCEYPAAFGKALSLYARRLSDFGLEHPDAGRDRETLEALPGVAGAKGCGAMLSDAVVVVLADSSLAGRTHVIATAEARGLRLLTGPAGVQSGSSLPLARGIEVNA